ncbi:uncharacterized protein LOC122009622 [Zingiber officinale]|uniref:uncharacterized protein LOC122009622 n=1 Tax=Zingiber officinale TaxID=94328 RepID=UPI001C4C63AB|nr:uncharacterized protein LOC122009622 [Zingiber officinale]
MDNPPLAAQLIDPNETRRRFSFPFSTALHRFEINPSPISGPLFPSVSSTLQRSLSCRQLTPRRPGFLAPLVDHLSTRDVTSVMLFRKSLVSDSFADFPALPANASFCQFLCVKVSNRSARDFKD